MDKFRVGQKVRIIDTFPQYSYLLNQVTFIASQSYIDHDGDRVYQLDLKNSGGEIFCGAEQSLEPVYDGDEKSSWSECIWNPHKVKA